MLTLCQPQDLNQDDQFVRSALLQWAASLKDFGFDGLRIDTVPEVKPSFWSDFTQAAAMYTVGMSATAAQSYQCANKICRRGFERRRRLCGAVPGWYHRASSERAALANISQVHFLRVR